MTANKIPISEQDRLFRERVLSLLQSAKRSVEVISGELGAYDFPELRGAAQEAANRGVKIDVYATDPRPDVAGRLRSSGVHVIVGAVRAYDHFLAVDGETVIESVKGGRKTATKVGSRDSVLYTRDPSRAKAVSAYLKFLEGASWGRDPAQLILSFVEELSGDPAALTDVPIAQNLLDLLGMPSTTVSAFMNEALERGRLLGIISPEKRGQKARDPKVANAVVLLSLYLAASAGLTFPSPPSLPGGFYGRSDVERGLRLINTPVRTEPFPQP